MSNISKTAKQEKERTPRKSGMTAAGTVPPVLAAIAQMPDEALVNQPVVEGLAGCSAATVWRRVKAGLLPQPVRISHTTRWRLGQVRAALKGGN